MHGEEMAGKLELGTTVIQCAFFYPVVKCFDMMFREFL